MDDQQRDESLDLEKLVVVLCPALHEVSQDPEVGPRFLELLKRHYEREFPEYNDIQFQ